MRQIDQAKVVCEFCNSHTEFINSRQVTLRIDKTNAYQNLFAIICNKCDKSGKKKTVNGQFIKIINNKNKLKNEESLFDEDEGD